jgi:hypothetical protein
MARLAQRQSPDWVFQRRQATAFMIAAASPEELKSRQLDSLPRESEIEPIHIIAHGRPAELSYVAGSVLLDSSNDDAENVRSIAEALDQRGLIGPVTPEKGKGLRPRRVSRASRTVEA